MNIGDLMIQVHKPAILEELIPMQVILENNELTHISKDLINVIAEKLNVDVNELFIIEKDIYVIKNRIPFVTDLMYWISGHDDLIEQEAQRHQHFFNNLSNIVERKNFHDIYIALSASGYNKVSLLFYQMWKEDMPFEDRLNYIREVYIDNEYGFSEFLIDEFLILLKSQEANRDWEKELKPLVKKGYLTVYRGEEDKSTKSEKAISWTTSFKTAIFFASRYTIEGGLIKGKVKLEDVLLYTNQRNEQEVISEKVYDIEEINQYSSKEVITKIKNSPISTKANISYVELFNSFKGFLTPDLFNNPNGYHGTLHSKRVLLLSIAMACEENIQDQELLALCDIAAFHDIGRETEGEEPNHGIKSWDKLIKKGLMQSSTKEYVDIVEFVIKAHDEGDKKARKRLQNTFSIKNKTLALKLYNIMCDADALDRVRLGDLDPNYLRTDVAKKMIIFAKNCLHHVKDK